MEEDKKVERKRKRFAARLKSSKGIICTDTPGPYIALCNVGQATGLQKETILILITSIAPDMVIPRFVAEKGETHSYLVFSSTEEAVLFYNTYNGKENIEIGSPIYMNFVEDVPNTEIRCPHDNPMGLTLLNDFITPEEEKEFIAQFDWTDETSNLKNRQVRHYGYEFRYGSNDVDLNSPLEEKIPDVCNVLWEKLKGRGFEIGKPDQLTVNKYLPGQGIPTHVDKHSPFGGTILSLSLGSSVLMDWRHHSGTYVPVHVEARSLLVMTGEARYDWQHGIQPRTWDPILRTTAEHRVITSDTVPRQTRISLTFRWTRAGPCECSYKTLCDSAKREIDDEVASNLEELHVHQVYERIAPHFSTTRHKPWPRVVQFARRAAPGAVLLDLGCGNGKNILHRTDILQIAGERSGALLAECARHAAGAARAGCVRLDALRAALRDACADLVLCIAVVHHFSSQARRSQAIETIVRLLRPGGHALVTVWAKDQTKSNYLSKNKPHGSTDEVLSVNGVSLPIHENRTQFKHNDLLVPWKLRSQTEDKLSNQPVNTLFRYYHVFEENELEKLCSLPNVEIESSFYEEGNWCVIFRKI